MKKIDKTSKNYYFWVQYVPNLVEITKAAFKNFLFYQKIIFLPEL